MVEPLSRIKDYYDLALLSRMYPFEGEHLIEAIIATFRRRGTGIEPTGLTDEFYADPAKSGSMAGICAPIFTVNKTSGSWKVAFLGAGLPPASLRSDQPPQGPADRTALDSTSASSFSSAIRPVSAGPVCSLISKPSFFTVSTSAAEPLASVTLR